MSSPEVVVYGASGYTGKLISWHLAERGIPFVAAGRSKSHVEAEMRRVPELADGTYECAEAPLERSALAALFKGKKVVYNVVGPFMPLSEPVVQAALDAGCHYLDTSGEQDWLMKLRDEYGSQFAAKERILAPTTAWMWIAGNIAAEFALETPGIDTIDLLYFGDSNTSEASTNSFLRMCCRDQYYLKNNELQIWPHTQVYDVVVPDDHQIFPAVPWSGGSEPIWYQHDERVRNVSVMVGFRRRDMMAWVSGRIEDWYANHRHKSVEEQEKLFKEWGAGLVATEPDRETKDENRSVVSCKGRGRTEGVSVVARGNSPYIEAAVWAAECVQRLLINKNRTVGFTSPCAAFGHRELAAATAELGYLTWDIRRD
ncbi:MAG: DUF5938 domain-containing protein [Ottowia sp.]|nr:DUF5938 domain-containing protein [Ottowia sp.]